MEPSIVFGAPLLWAKSSGGTSGNLSWGLGLEVMEWEGNQKEEKGEEEEQVEEEEQQLEEEEEEELQKE